jgi:hypothetical protein
MRRISNDKTLNTLNASWILTENTSNMDISDSFSKSESNIGSFSHDPSFQELLATLRTNSFCGNFQPSTLNILTENDEWIRLPKRQKNKEIQINATLSRSNVSLDGSIESTVPCCIEENRKCISEPKENTSMPEILRVDTISRKLSNLALAHHDFRILPTSESKLYCLERREHG